MWRDHIKFFVDYTVAKAKKDNAGQNKAVANLKQYTITFGNLLAGATVPVGATGHGRFVCAPTPAGGLPPELADLAGTPVEARSVGSAPDASG